MARPRKKPPQTPFAQWFDRTMTRSEMTPKELSAKADLPLGTIYALMRGEWLPSMDMLERLATALYRGDPNDTTAFAAFIAEARQIAFVLPGLAKEDRAYVERCYLGLHLLASVEGAPFHAQKAIEHLLRLNASTENSCIVSLTNSDSERGMLIEKDEYQPSNVAEENVAQEMGLTATAREILDDIRKNPDFKRMSETELRGAARSIDQLFQARLAKMAS